MTMSCYIFTISHSEERSDEELGQGYFKGNPVNRIPAV